MKKKHLILLGSVAILAVSSCKKEGCTNPDATNYDEKAKTDDGSCIIKSTSGGAATEPGTYTPVYSGTFGSLIAIKTINTTTQGGFTFDTEIGTAVAAFSEDGGANWMDAGTITCEGETLTKNSNNSYTYIPGTSNPTGLTFSNPVNWTASGSSWPAFGLDNSDNFSTLGDISSSTTIASSSSYTLTSPSISGADSVYFGIYGPDGSVFKIQSGSTTSHTFTAAEISGLGTGSAYIQVVGLNYEETTFSGRDYYMINESVRTKSATIQ
jgi:hypothetical protein